MNRKTKSYKPPLWIATRKVYFNKDLRYRLTPEVDRLLYRVSDHTTIRHNYDLMEDAFSCILANLHHADVMDAPLVYSRNSNAYKIERNRYGYEFYTYWRIVRIVDTMFELGLIQGVKGRKLSSGATKSSKMWPTEELLEMFGQMKGEVYLKRNNEVLFLKDEKKCLKDYKDNVITQKMKVQLCEINEMLSSLKIDFQFSYENLSDKPVSRINKIIKLRSLLFSNQIQVIPEHNLNICRYERFKYRLGYKRRLTTKYYNESDHDAYLLYKYKGIELAGSVNKDSNYLKRVFNVDWYHGGRFYQAPHVTIPSACRKTIIINDEPSVELDYSGQHIRMLYNLIKIDYRDECYVYPKNDETNKNDRKRIKLASLIVINSINRKKAIKAIHNQCRKKGIHYPAGQYGRYSVLVDRFEKYHEPIKDFFLKGKGLELQYKDSTIMANILEQLMKRNIPALPVHDSIICPARNEGFLHQIMIDEYEKVMGFKPIIG